MSINTFELPLIPQDCSHPSLKLELLMYNTLKHAHTSSSLKMKQSYLHVRFHRLPQEPGTGFIQYFPIASMSHRPSPGHSVPSYMLLL